MDSLHTVLRSLRGEKARRDHLTVFREFLGHLDRIGKRQARMRSTNTAGPARNGVRRGK
jgi:hypothetical protein